MATERTTQRTTRRSTSPAGAGEAKKACLFVLTGDLRGTRLDITEGRTRLGRGTEMEIRFPTDDSISRHHAEILLEKGGVRLLDAGSTNGTYVNGLRVQESVLKDGDRIHVGATAVKFFLADDVEASCVDEMYRMATRDGLTDVFNKRFFLDQLEVKISEMKRMKQPLALLMMDVDHFKKINDQYGHVAGDQVLQGLASVGKSCVRKEDIFARYGGEEFSVIAARLDANHAWTLAEKIRESVMNHLFIFEPHRIPVTISVGGCVMTAEGLLPSEEFIKKADSALYEAKRFGRNRTVIAG